jgi:TolB protein
MVHRKSGSYKIAVLDLRNGTVQVISSGNMDESPSFSPNGQMIVYASERNDGASTLSSVSVGGNAQQRLSHERDSAREPAWAPFGQN